MSLRPIRNATVKLPTTRYGYERVLNVAYTRNVDGSVHLISAHPPLARERAWRLSTLPRSLFDSILSQVKAADAAEVAHVHV